MAASNTRPTASPAILIPDLHPCLGQAANHARDNQCCRRRRVTFSDPLETMASFLPRRFRGETTVPATPTPSWASKRLTPLVQYLSRLACSHPIHTVVIVAVLASTSYVGLLQESL